MRIDVGDPLASDVLVLLEGHLADMRRTSPPESVHALDPHALAAADVTFLTARDRGRLLGCGAVKDLHDGTGEVKSMRTADAARGRGVTAAVLAALVAHARDRGWSALLLETGSQAFFEPAVRLHRRHGFVLRGPFGDHTDDPSSRYLQLALRTGADGGNSASVRAATLHEPREGRHNSTAEQRLARPARG